MVDERSYTSVDEMVDERSYTLVDGMVDGAALVLEAADLPPG